MLDHLITELTSMTEHRRIRMLQSRKGLPGILWAVLIVGAVVTIGTSCFFGVDNLRLHAMDTIALTLLVSLMLIAIAHIDRPFQGAVHVPPDGFNLALKTFKRLRGG
jgi:purine-cytosine permease-like protein